MITRRTLLAAPLIPLVGFGQTESGRRRALIVGINTYRASRNARAAVRPPGTKPRILPQGPYRPRGLDDLSGAVNDARLMRDVLISQHAFRPADIVVLENEQATAARILGEFERHLVIAGARGDTAVFFFAGHGSQIVNRGTAEQDQLDETLVLYDYQAEGDIRDKELARLYRAAVQRGVRLTVIFDCCHSGGLSRGPQSVRSVRFAPPDSRWVTDPPDRDAATGELLPDPSELGILFLAASRENEAAEEEMFREARHGAFTARLIQALQSSSPNEAAGRIFARLETRFRASSFLQQPQVFGKQRLNLGLWGQPADSITEISVLVESVAGNLAVLRMGTAAGISPGCIFHNLDASARVEVTDVAGPIKSTGLIRTGAVRPGDLLTLQQWVPVQENPLRVFVAMNGPSETELRQVGALLESLAEEGHLGLFREGPMTTVRFVLRWSDGAWRMEGPTGANGLGKVPTRAQLLAAMPKGEALLVLMPPHAAFAKSFRAKTLPVLFAAGPEQADYELAGEIRQGRLTYRWCLRDFHRLPVHVKQLPRYTDDQTSEEELAASAAKLAKIHGWLTLPLPPGGATRFPYRLTIQKVGGTDVSSGQEVHVGDHFKLFLTAEAADIESLRATGGIPPHYIYIFCIGADGSGTLLFPRDPLPSNRLPRDLSDRLRLAITDEEFDFTIALPTGHDSYFLLISEEAIPQAPLLFTWRPVSNDSLTGARGALGLAGLLSGVGSSWRARSESAVPARWTLDRYSLVTVE